jgi:hypothetical protein
VREIEDRDYPGRIAASEKARGAQPRHPSGPSDQEDGTAEDWDAGAGQRVFAAGISTVAQPALPGGGSGGRGLSPAGAECGGIARSTAAGERANPQQ